MDPEEIANLLNNEGIHETRRLIPLLEQQNQLEEEEDQNIINLSEYTLKLLSTTSPPIDIRITNNNIYQYNYLNCNNVSKYPLLNDILIIFLFIIIWFIIILYYYYNYKIKKINKIKYKSYHLKDWNYQVLFWSYPEIIMDKIEEYLLKIIRLTRKLNSIDENNLPIVDIDQFKIEVYHLNQVISSLMDIVNPRSQPVDIEEEEFLFKYRIKLSLTQSDLKKCKDIINYFISTKNRLIYDLNQARVQENVSYFTFNIFLIFV